MHNIWNRTIKRINRDNSIVEKSVQESLEYQGEVAERFNALVLKTNVASQSPRVRIPPSPFIFFFQFCSVL